MRMVVRGWIVIVAFVVGSECSAQQPPDKTRLRPDRMDIAVMFDATRTNLSSGNSFWMQGGSVEAAGSFFHGLGAVAQMTATHSGSISSSGTGLTLFTVDVGPRYTWHLPSASKNKHPMNVFAQALMGVSRGSDSAFPSVATVNSSASSFAFQMGGGWNVKLARRVGWRVVEADWLYTQLPNGGTNAQNHLFLNTGVVTWF